MSTVEASGPSSKELLKIDEEPETGGGGGNNNPSNFSVPESQESDKQLLHPPPQHSARESFQIEDGNDDKTSYAELGSSSPNKLMGKRNLGNCFGLWLDTKGEHDDGAYAVSGSFALISVLVLLGVGLLTVKHLDSKLPEALQVKDIPNHPNR